MTITTQPRRALVAGLLLAAISATAAYADPPSYHLWCRGGGSAQINVGTEVNSAGTFLEVGFTPASAAATAATPPGPGQCSWADRALHADEPHFLRFQKATGFAAYVSVRADGAAPPGLGLSSTDPVSSNSAQKIWDAIFAHPGDLHVEAYNSGHGYLTVTRVYYP